MSDFNSSLPVRTENNGDVVSKISDGTVTSQLLSVDASGFISDKLHDGAGNSVTSQVNGSQRALDVGIDVAGVQIDPRQIRFLTSASDSVVANQGTPNTAANGWPVKPTDGTNSQSFTGAGEAKVDVTQPLPAGTNNIGFVNANIWVSSSSASIVNPVPVTIVDTIAGVSYVNDYNTAAAVAAGATSNHDYTITSGKTFRGSKFWGSASGKLKIEVQISPDGVSFTSKWVGFNSTATPNISIDLDMLSIAESGVGSKIRIIRTNEDKAAMDVYSTISGTEQ